MHEGAHGSGAPKGERNGNYRHGFYTAEAIAERRAVTALIRKLAVRSVDLARVLTRSGLPLTPDVQIKV